MRTSLREDHEQFRDQVRKFVQREIAPHHHEWEKAGCVPRETWLKAGREGLLLPAIPEEYGGGGGDFGHSIVVIEELMRVLATGPGFPLHSDIVAPYLLAYGTEAQKHDWLPAMARGEKIGAIAMTEPGIGSDLKAMRTTARRDGDSYVINGGKTFITNGANSDLVIVACKTNPDAGTRGISLIVVDAGTQGFTKGPLLEKIGLKAQDTCELFFDNVRVPAANLLGEEGKGFGYLMHQLAQERLMIAVRSPVVMETMLEETINYTKSRKAFGQPIFDHQNTRFKLAEIKAKTVACRIFVDHCISLHFDKALSADLAAMAKLYATEAQGQAVDELLQLHGGYGFMREYPVARAFVDSRVQRIYGGTSEIMKEIISRGL
ncbi:acyl-CoA dehydrogenase family protein [Variovorax sp. J22P240]|uniref:acyl-CoA dehydrogenase family protein n=1 Tax=unclassified Variovorax TaxID=663243 RepID=UPI0025749C63|nr:MULTISPECIES: acyl-CoA dehydrogenase family protein [unclassified Variovorax]MDM0000304.1 acyl-CoA dehydrogenase family protein [Variovorax sp. J22P240]MDM0053369.1 acyl-CoA dehydrogenase family protein [Variovorax sp. J22R115]